MAAEFRRVLEAILSPRRRRGGVEEGEEAGAGPARRQPPEPARGGSGGGEVDVLPVPGDTLLAEAEGGVVEVEEASPPEPRRAVEAAGSGRVVTPLGPAEVLAGPGVGNRFREGEVVGREGWRLVEVIVDWRGGEVAAVFSRGGGEYMLAPRRRGVFEEAKLVEAGFVPVFVEAGGARRRVYAGVFGRLVDVNIALCSASLEPLVVRRGGESVPLC